MTFPNIFFYVLRVDVLAGVKHAVATTAQLVSSNDFTQLRGLLSRAELKRLKKEVSSSPFI
jgi:hypothetical protein